MWKVKFWSSQNSGEALVSFLTTSQGEMCLSNEEQFRPCFPRHPHQS